jgi:aspartate/methionine/tyrosine aminotransferase
MFSTRAAAPREVNEWTRQLERARSAGELLFDLTQSNPTRAAVPYPERRLLAALSDARALRYEPEAFGMASARQAVREEWGKLGRDVPLSRIVLTASTSEAYSLLFKLLCDPGDEVLVPAPSYPLFEHLARFECVRPVQYPLAFDGAWYIDFERLRAVRSARTRALVVVSPNNPTGSYLRRVELERLAELGLPLISDEVFASYPLRRPASAASSALEASESLVFALSGLSKLAALPQMKAAWLTVGGPPAAADEALGRLELMADAYLSVGAPVQLALPELLAAREPTEAHILARLWRNLTVLERRAHGASFSVLPVEGGWYAVLRLPRTASEEDWALGLLREQRVLAQPGYFYDFADEPFLIVSLLTEEPIFDVGVERLALHVQRHSA